jgi:signal transduction histidine kinase
MKTFLVFHQHARVLEATQQIVAATAGQLLVAGDVREAEAVLASGRVDVVILDAAAPDATTLVGRLRAMDAAVAIIASADAPNVSGDHLYVAGATRVVSLPWDRELFTSLPVARWTSVSPVPAAPAPETADGTAALRHLGKALESSSEEEALLRNFCAGIRDALSVNRVAIFIRDPSCVARGELRLAASVGLDPLLASQLKLRLNAGLARHIYQAGRICRSHESADPAVVADFSLAGATAAVPIVGPSGMSGILLLDDRVTGEPLLNRELAALFTACDKLGALLHARQISDQLSAKQLMINGLLDHLETGCVVLDRNLELVHVNEAARRFLSPGSVLFALPQDVREKVHKVFETGAPIGPEIYTAAGTAYELRVVPFRNGDAAPESVLILVTDRREAERLQRLEVEGASAALLKTMAERFAHEVGNCLVPISTHEQLLAAKWNDPEFRASLGSAMSEGVKRIQRLANQMLFIAGSTNQPAAQIDVSALVVDAFREAESYYTGRAGRLDLDAGADKPKVHGNEKALRYALAEIMLNALQANPDKPNILVRIRESGDGNGAPHVEIEVRDTGSGFTSDVAARAHEPFYSTRNVGLGLGLAVSRTIIDAHNGRMEAVVAPGTGILRVTLPMA